MAGRFRCTGTLERAARAAGYRCVAGADEAGRGSLFGPVFAAAVVLAPERPLPGLGDSKVIPPDRRAELAAEIEARAMAWAIGCSDANEIDRVNVYQASRLAMKRALQRLSVPCDYLLADAIAVDWPVPQQAVVHGDAKVRCIAAASILAKVHRDRCLEAWDREFPRYGLARHKGYATAEHLEALRRFGPTPLHRLTYEPVRSSYRFARVEIPPEQMALAL
ncbi:MAG TPA: ribonuclease HII [Solibacterales bacterium]|nr:ribonuclease HII [Bryobacterales bacterium]